MMKAKNSTRRGRERNVEGQRERRPSSKSRKTVVNSQVGSGRVSASDNVSEEWASDALIASVAPLPPDEVGQEHDEDEPR